MFAEVHKQKKKSLQRKIFHPPLQENNGPFLKKLVKYANWRTDDVIYSTQFYVRSKNWIISVIFLQRAMKLGRLIVLRMTHVQLELNHVTMETRSFPVPTNFLNIFKFSVQKSETRGRCLPNPFILLQDHAYKALLTNNKNECQNWPKAFSIRGIWNLARCHGNQIVKSILWNTTSRVLLQKIRDSVQIGRDITFLIFNQNLVYDVITLQICIF